MSCWRHKWSKWSDPEHKVYEVTRLILGRKVGPVEMTQLEQTKTCEKCGKVKLRVLSSE